jgi:glycine/D-amino acid oxidase-like deaminating enzyme
MNAALLNLIFVTPCIGGVHRHLQRDLPPPFVWSPTKIDSARLSTNHHRALYHIFDIRELIRTETPARLDNFFDGRHKIKTPLINAYAALALTHTDIHGRVTPALQKRLTADEKKYADRFSGSALKRWQTLVAVTGAKTTLPIGVPEINTPYWQFIDHPLANYQSTPLLPKSAEVVVIGAGLAGAAAAYSVGNAVLIDADDPATLASGMNGGNFQLLAENYAGHYAGIAKERAELSRPLYPDLTPHQRQELGDYQARAILKFGAINRDTLFSNVKKEGIDADLTPNGWIRAAMTAQEARGLADEVKLAQAMGLDMRALSPEELDRMMRLPVGTNKFGGRLSESDGNYHPFKYVNGLISAALKNGLRLYTRTQVNRIEDTQDGFIVKTSRGDIRAKKVIVATNGTVSHLVPELASIQLRRSQLQVTLHARSNWGGATVTDHKGDFYANFPMGEAYDDDDHTLRSAFLAGGGRDTLTHAQNIRDMMRSSVVSRFLIRHRNHLNPELIGTPPFSEWAGPLGYTLDQLPAIGELRKGLIIIAGFCGYGGTYTQAAGLAAAIIARTGRAPDWAPQDIFSPQRFVGR